MQDKGLESFYIYTDTSELEYMEHYRLTFLKTAG